MRKCLSKPCFYDRPPEEITYDIFFSKWILLTLIPIGYLILIVSVSSILTLFRSQKSRSQKKQIKEDRKVKIKSTMQKLKKLYKTAPNPVIYKIKLILLN